MRRLSSIAAASFLFVAPVAVHADTFVHAAQLLGQAEAITPPCPHAGHAVAVDGDTAVIGTDRQGVAYVFVRSSGTWTLQQVLGAYDSASDPNGSFGSSVALSGDTLVVGARLATTSAGMFAGAAYVFTRTASVWTLQAKLTASDPGEFQFFGTGVAIEGNRALVGAPLAENPGSPSSGAAYLFLRSGTAWVLERRLSAADVYPVAYFGTSVAMDADRVLVGAPSAHTAAGPQRGAGYVFRRLGPVWIQDQKLEAPDGTQYANLGSSVSLSGSTAVLGAWGDAGYAGAAYVFERSAVGWTEQQKLTASSPAPEDRFGWSVSVEGDTVAVGIPGDDTAAGADSGSAVVFVRTGGSWAEQQVLSGSTGHSQALLGQSVSISGETLLTGAPGPDQSTSGETYAFVRTGTAWNEEQEILIPDSTATDNLGGRLALSGDTLIVGAAYDDTLEGGQAGAAYVFVRSGSAWLQQQKLTSAFGGPDSFLGSAVAIDGDTAVVGAYGDSGGTGAARVFVRRGTSWTEQDQLVPQGASPSDYYGSSVAVSGDTAMIGSLYGTTVQVFVRSGATWSFQQSMPAGTGSYPGAHVSISGDTAAISATAGFGSGSAQIWARSGGSWSLQQDLVPSEFPRELYGWDVSLSGDTVAVGDGSFGTIYPGSVWIFTRSGTAWSEQQRITPSDQSPNDRVAERVSVFGDVLAVGASEQSLAGVAQAGSVYAYVRSGGVWTQQQKLVAPDFGPSDMFGRGVAASADVIAVGAPLDDTPSFNAGSAHVYRRAAGGTADLSVTKSDGQSIAPRGQPLTYSIAVSNAGPDAVVLAGVTDALPAALLGGTWSCTATAGSGCPPTGSGGIDAVAGLVPGGTVTFSLTGTVDPGASGNLVNTASVTLPAGIVDPDISNNSATDTDAIVTAVDLSVTKTDGQAAAVPGQHVTYTIAVSNAGPGDAVGAMVTDTMPASLQTVVWSCAASGGASCTPAGIGSIGDTVTLPASGAVTYSVTGRLDPSASGSLTNAATVTAPAAVYELDPSDDSAADTDSILAAGFLADGELSHGYQRWHDLATLPGPAADADLFRLFQRPHASYDVQLDGASGDLGSGSGPILERLGSDAATVVQESVPAGVGASRSLRWINTSDQPVADEFVRVQSAGCTTDCDASDVYRLAAYETTGFVSRFNNDGTQITVLVVQNLGDAAIDLDVVFWSAAGDLPAAPTAASLGPRQSYILDTSTIVPGMGGSITVANTGRYGQVQGKTVAVEPATGFTFETPLLTRPR